MRLILSAVALLGTVLTIVPSLIAFAAMGPVDRPP